MLSISRRTETTGTPRRSRGAFTLSIIVNAVAIVLFFRAITAGYRWSELLGVGPSREVPTERIGFVQLPRATGPAVAGKSGGDGRPIARRVARPAPAAPTAVPETITPANPEAAPVEQGGSGPVVGSGGATQGIEPSYADSRLWAPAGSGRSVVAPGRAKEQIDSVIADLFGGVRDSMVAEQQARAGQRKPGDWTVNGPGGKWGIDQSSIHLGKIAIPNAILALLSADLQRNLRGNPIEYQNDRRLAAIRADLLQHAEREQNEDMFRNAVKEIRARKDRERAARLAEQKGQPADPNPDKR
jgi:hypothetical protein